MMIHAYSESYLSDAKCSMAEMLDYAINDCKLNIDWFTALFLQSGYARQFETGNPGILSGLSGIELARAVLTAVNCEDDIKTPSFPEDRSPEYWAGWALAEYQWFSARTFKDIFSKISASKMVQMYPAYHEMDISQFIETMEGICASSDYDTKLKKIRESRGLSQSELAQASGVSLRSIQVYEQRINDIDKAQAHTLYKLARVLNCEMEELLEGPMLIP